MCFFFREQWQLHPASYGYRMFQGATQLASTWNLYLETRKLTTSSVETGGDGQMIVRLLHAHKFLHGFRRENTRTLTRKSHKLCKNGSLTCCVVFFEHLPSARAMVQGSNTMRREDGRKRRITLPPTPPSADSDADGLAKASAAMGL